MTYYIKKHKIIVSIAVLLLIINSFIQVTATTQLAQVANALIANDSQSFISNLLFVLMLWSITFCLSYVQQNIQEKAIQVISKSIRLDLANKIINMERRQINKEVIAQYISFMQNDINLIEDKGLNSFFAISRFLANGIFSLIALLFLNVYLFIVAIVLLILLNSIPKLLKKLTRASSQNVSSANNQFLSLIQDVLTGYETLKNFNAEHKLTGTIAYGSDLLSSAKQAYTNRQSIVNILISVLNISSQLIIIFTTGVLIFNKVISVGTILSTSDLSSKIFDSFSIVNRYYVLIDSVQPLFKMLEEDVVETNEVTQQHFERLEVKNLYYQYTGSDKVLFNNMSFTLEKGHKYHLVGASGSGKSTLLKILYKQLQPNSGQVLLNQKEYIAFDLVYLSQYLTQTAHIFKFSMDENICLGRKISPEKLALIKQTLNLDGIDINNLSGGERQKVALARVLVAPKDFVILDESFSNIDLDMTHKIIHLLNQNQITLLIITHREQELADLQFEKIVL